MDQDPQVEDGELVGEQQVRWVSSGITINNQ